MWLHSISVHTWCCLSLANLFLISLDLPTFCCQRLFLFNRFLFVANSSKLHVKLKYLTVFCFLLSMVLLYIYTVYSWTPSFATVPFVPKPTRKCFPGLHCYPFPPCDLSICVFTFLVRLALYCLPVIWKICKTLPSWGDTVPGFFWVLRNLTVALKAMGWWSEAVWRVPLET